MDDDELLDLIRDTIQAEATPEPLLQAAYRSRAWADVDNEIAALLEDSAALESAGVRDADSSRHLVFESSIGIADLTIESETGTISCRISPAASIVIQAVEGANVPVEDGAMLTSFRVSGLAAGPIRLQLSTDAGTWLTQSFTL